MLYASAKALTHFLQRQENIAEVVEFDIFVWYPTTSQILNHIASRIQIYLLVREMGRSCKYVNTYPSYFMMYLRSSANLNGNCRLRWLKERRLSYNRELLWGKRETLLCISYSLFRTRNTFSFSTVTNFHIHNFVIFHVLRSPIIIEYPSSQLIVRLQNYEYFLFHFMEKNYINHYWGWGDL